jgi:DNA-binding transcriptional ArsR family regulator
LETDNILNLESRRLIYNHIRDYPGIHLSELVRKTNFSEGTVRYHIRYLNKRNLIRIDNVDGYARYFLKNNIRNGHSKILNVVRKETPRRILLTLLIFHVFSKKQLSTYIKKNPSTIHHYLKILEKMDIVEPVKHKDDLIKINYEKNIFVKVKRNRRDIFYILKDPYLIYDIFIIYEKKLFDDKIVESFLDVYRFFSHDENIYSKKKKSIVVINYNDSIGNIEDVFKEFFPLPFVS